MTKPKHRSGTDHPNAKLTEKDIPEIRKLIADGVMLKDIAKQFGVCIQQISKIKHNRRWNHVPHE